jgi:prepilin-type N-terminal cleavage/methylation domain-containing protein
MHLNRLNRIKGFTLIELLVVISIIGLLSSVVLTNVSNAKKKALSSQIQQSMNELGKAFYIDSTTRGYYYGMGPTDLPPDPWAGQNVLNLTFLVTNKYISKIPAFQLGSLIYVVTGPTSQTIYRIYCGDRLVPDNHFFIWMLTYESLDLPVFSETRNGAPYYSNGYCIIPNQ